VQIKFPARKRAAAVKQHYRHRITQ